MQIDGVGKTDVLMGCSCYNLVQVSNFKQGSFTACTNLCELIGNFHSVAFRN